MVEGECNQYHFFPPSAGKPQFGNLSLVTDEDVFVSAVAFRGLSAKLDVKALPSSGWKVSGRLSHRAYIDNDGNSRKTVDLIADVAVCLYESRIDAELEELQAMAMAYIGKSDEKDGKKAI